MARRDRRVKFAIGGAVLFALCATAVFSFTSYQLAHTQQRERLAAGPGTHSEQVNASCVQDPRSRSFSCAIDAPVSTNDEQYAQLDLHAQQEMAEWAFAMLLVSCAGVLVTALGVIYVAQTLNETRKVARQTATATAAAQTAADAATTANDSFKTAAERQLRPFVFPEKITLQGSAGASPKIFVELRNSGQTPCYNMRVYAGVYLGPAAQFKQITATSTSGVDVQKLGDVGPAQLATIRLMTPDLLNHRGELASGEWILAVSGYVEYDDIFQKHHALLFGARAIQDERGGQTEDGPMATDEDRNGEVSRFNTYSFNGRPHSW